MSARRRCEKPFYRGQRHVSKLSSISRAFVEEQRFTGCGRARRQLLIALTAQEFGESQRANRGSLSPAPAEAPSVARRSTRPPKRVSTSLSTSIAESMGFFASRDRSTDRPGRQLPRQWRLPERSLRLQRSADDQPARVRTPERRANRADRSHHRVPGQLESSRWRPTSNNWRRCGFIERNWPPESKEAFAGIYKYAAWLRESGRFKKSASNMRVRCESFATHTAKTIPNRSVHWSASATAFGISGYRELKA